MPSQASRFLVGAALLSSFAFAQAAPDTKFDQVDAYLKEQIDKKRSPSYSVAVVKDGVVVYSTGVGMADLENDVAATASTVYRIGSITKQFTATMIMQLVNEGKLKLDDPFSKTLTDFPKAWDKVTVRQLLNHTSGIHSYTEIKGLFEGDAMKPTTPKGIVKTVEKDPLDFEPGSKWNYNNTGYELLGMLIEKLDARPYAESLKVRILEPVGMKNTFFTSERKLIKRRAQGYSAGKDGFEHAPYLNMDWPYAAGSMESTVLDLAKWDAALYGDKVVPQSTLKEMWTPTKLADGKVQKYGFGWELDSLNGFPQVSHGGGIHGFTTYLCRVPSKGITVVVLSNSDGPSNPGAVAKTILGMVEPSLKLESAKAIDDKDPAATAFAKSMLQSILDGKLDRSKLTPEFSKMVTPELEKDAKDHFSVMGKIEKFELLSEKEGNGIKARTYRVLLGTTEFRLDVQIDSKGLVAGFGIHQ